MLRVFNHNELLGHPGSGNSWEAFAIQQIINNLALGFDPHFYRTQDGSELDLIISKGTQIIAGIEIKHSNAPKLTKGNTLAIETVQSKNNFIVTPSSDDYPIRDNVRVCSLEQFLNLYLPQILS